MVRLGPFHRLDRLQVLLAGMLLVLGLMTVYSASATDFRKQLLTLGLGVAAYVARHYGRRVTLYTHPERLIKTIAWCTGAGGSLLGDAIAAGADAFITGEISEQHVHQARESNITLIGAGHHSTERDGVAALASRLVQKFGVTYQFIDISSPI